MKITRIALALTACTTLFFTGCSKEAKAEITAISDVQTGKLEENAGTYVGDNSKVLEILRGLPGGETIKELKLFHQSIDVAYGHKEGAAISEEQINEYWSDGKDREKKNFYFNAIYLTLLVPNAKEYILHTDESKLAVSREEMVHVLSKGLKGFPNSKDIWNKAAVSTFIDQNAEKMKKMAEHHNQYFK